MNCSKSDMDLHYFYKLSLSTLQTWKSLGNSEDPDEMLNINLKLNTLPLSHHALLL